MSDFSQELHTEVMEEYEKIRSKNKEVYEKTVSAIYDNLPRLKEIDNQLKTLAVSICAQLVNSNVSPENAIEKLKTQTDKLISEKTEILKSNGVSPDSLAEKFDCEICKDKGYINGKRCKCYMDKLQNCIQKRSNISRDKLHTFAKFDLELYSEKVNKEYGISAKENAESIKKTAMDFAKGKKGCPTHLLFYGNTGLGKTFTSECVAREYIRQGKSVFYTSAPRLFSIFEDYKFGRNTTEEAKRTIDYIAEVDLLIIDDLGTEFRTQYVDSILFDTINTRINQGKSMIISTNLSLDQINSTYSQRISSRFIGNFDLIYFFGDDIRLK